MATKKKAGKAKQNGNGHSKYVILRTTGAGVHVGRLVSRDGDTVTLADARRIWRWRGGNTLNELALRGADEVYTRISEPIDEIAIHQVHEELTITEAARANLTRSRWGQ